MAEIFGIEKNFPANLVSINRAWPFFENHTSLGSYRGRSLLGIRHHTDWSREKCFLTTPHMVYFTHLIEFNGTGLGFWSEHVYSFKKNIVVKSCIVSKILNTNYFLELYSQSNLKMLKIIFWPWKLLIVHR